MHALSKVDDRVPVLSHGLRSVVGMPLLELRSKLRKVECLGESENRQFRVSCTLHGGKGTHFDVADVVLVLETASKVCRLGTTVAVCAMRLSVS